MYDTRKVRELNDAFRATLTGGRLMLTRGILNRQDTNDIVRRVQHFDTFTSENDPYQEHDFGAFEAGHDSIFWKIDLYEDDSVKDKNDPRAMRRVLTIMLAEEY